MDDSLTRPMDPRPAPAPGGPERPVTDVPALLRRCIGSWAILERVLQRFCEDAPAQLRRLEEGLGKKDAGELAGLAHTIKGTAANLSTECVQAAAAELEKTAPMATEHELECLVRSLQQEVQRCLDAVPGILAAGAPSPPSNDTPMPRSSETEM